MLSTAEGKVGAGLRECAAVTHRLVGRYGALFLFALVVTLLCWGSNAFSTNVRIDGAKFISYQGTMSDWLGIGHWGQLIVKTLLGTVNYNPYYAGLLFVIIWPVSALVWPAAFEKARGKKFWFGWAFVLMYLVSQWWSFGFYFMMMATEVVVGITLIPFAIMLLLRAAEARDDGVVGRAWLLLVAASSLCYAVYIVGVDHSVLRTVPSARMTFWVLAAGAALFFALTGFGANLHPLAPTAACLGNVLGIGLVPTIIPILFINIAIKNVGPTYSAIIGALEPVTALVIGAVVFGEQVTGRILLGAAMILVAVTLIVARPLLSRVPVARRHKDMS